MGVWYRLVNTTKREQITFSRLPAVKAREIAGNPAAAAITAWYLLENSGDTIGFVSDDLDSWPFDSGSLAESRDFEEVTDKYVDCLISEGILRDNGILWQDEDGPELYLRDIRNCWMPKDLL